MGRRTAVDASATRQAIVDAAFKLFGRAGYDGVSIDRISKASGLSKSAMYWHFKNKADLFIACLGRLDDIFNKHIFSLVQAEQDASRRVMAFFAGLSDLLQDQSLTAGIGGYWLEPHGAGTDHIRAVQEEHDALRIQIAADTFRMGQQNKQFQFTQDADEMARGLMAVMEATILPLRRQTPEQNMQTVHFLMETFFKAYARQA